MIGFFKESRRTAVFGSVLGAVVCAAAAWFLYSGEMSTRIILMVVAAALAVNVAVYAAKLIAMRRYQEILLLLYEKMEPQAFLDAALPILDAKAGTADRVTHAAHVANGYLALGKAGEAADLLERQQVPDQARALKGLVYSNLGTAYLLMEDRQKAAGALEGLRSVAADPKCKEKFRQKARHIIAYQQLCLDVLDGKNSPKQALEKDFETSRSPLHKANAAVFLRKIYGRTGEWEKAERVGQAIRFR